MATGFLGTSALALAKIGEVLLATTTASITFSSIPGGYRNLRLVWYGRDSNASTNDGLQLRCNGDAGANYDNAVLDGVGTTPGSIDNYGQTSAQIGAISGNNAPAGVFAGGWFVVPNYANASNQQLAIGTSANKWGTTSGSAGTRLCAVYWRSAGPITSLTLFPNNGSFLAGSLFTLYGEP